MAYEEDTSPLGIMLRNARRLGLEGVSAVQGTLNGVRVLDRSFENLYQDCVKNLGEPDKALLYLQKMRSKYNSGRRTPAPLKRWTAEDGTPPDGLYLNTLNFIEQEPYSLLQVKDGWVHSWTWRPDPDPEVIGGGHLVETHLWPTGDELFGPIEAEGGAE